jgi:protein-tyrosine-phosphatase/tRNA A37 threonylcarbamoyladenosine synthetase subunit TsaC/SUA5/YrdC
MPEVIDWHGGMKSRAIRRAVRALADGRLVALPTEASYGVAASGLVPDAVARLGTHGGPLTLALRDAADVPDWVPTVSPLGRRLANRCWPGPVELRWAEAQAGGLMRRLPVAVGQQLCAGGDFGLRAPGHPSFLLALRRAAGPIVFRASRVQPDDEAITADEVLQTEGDRVDLVINDGPTRYRRPATAVRVNGTAWEVVQEGIVSRELLARMSSCLVVFVCTGNTCRSPMAEALFKKLLAERLGCGPDNLAERGYLVQSAGLSAAPGGPAADEAVAIVHELGGDLTRHASQPVSQELVAQADHLVAMTDGHRRLLERHFPRSGCTPRLLCPEGRDVADPVGCGPDVYRACAQQIFAHLQALVAEVHPA